jgi:hypothetical protein
VEAVLDLQQMLRQQGRQLLQRLFGARRMVPRLVDGGYRIEGLARLQLDGGAGDR